jgi:D-serine deaminase-like pyridoxal phosphate-dependent protein
MDYTPPPLDSTADLLSPSLVIFRDRVVANIDRMNTMAGGAHRLRPHVKTHKMADVIRLCNASGIRKYKCATIAEAEMTANAGGQDVLMSYPLVGPNIWRFLKLQQFYGATKFAALADDLDTVGHIAEAAKRHHTRIALYLDVDLGMNRTGIAPGDRAFEIYKTIAESPHLIAAGLHGYDGHIRDETLEARKTTARPGQEAILAFRDRLTKAGLPVPAIVLGGSPSFPTHFVLDDPIIECSPGTLVFNDSGYGSRYEDLPFPPAVYLLTRVVSRPGTNRLCLDLGHKAVAADPTPPRARILALPDAEPLGQSEEHLVISCPDPSKFPIGTALWAVPSHICPTIALQNWAYVAEGGKIVGRWDVTARGRVISI